MKGWNYMITVLSIIAIIIVALIVLIITIDRLPYRTQKIGVFQIFIGVLGLLSAIVLGYFVVYYYTSSIKGTWDDIQSKKAITVSESTDTGKDPNTISDKKESVQSNSASEGLDNPNNWEGNILRGSVLLVIIMLISAAVWYMFLASEKLLTQKE